MKIKEYLKNYQIFPLMGVQQLTPVASRLDNLLRVKYGERELGNLVSSYDVSQLTTDEQTEIAQLIYMLNSNKWKTLFEFVDANLTPWIESEAKTTTTFGKVVGYKQSGSDSYTETEQLAGFDSTDFADSGKNDHTTTYGKGTETSNSGSNVVAVEKRSEQAEKLVDYTIEFWNKNGLYDTILRDTVRVFSLPIYKEID